MSKENCLVKKAKEECQCDNCKSLRYWNAMSLVAEMQKEVMDIVLGNKDKFASQGGEE